MQKKAAENVSDLPLNFESLIFQRVKYEIWELLIGWEFLSK